MCLVYSQVTTVHPRTHTHKQMLPAAIICLKALCPDCIITFNGIWLTRFRSLAALTWKVTEYYHSCIYIKKHFKRISTLPGFLSSKGSRAAKLYCDLLAITNIKTPPFKWHFSFFFSSSQSEFEILHNIIFKVWLKQLQLHPTWNDLSLELWQVMCFQWRNNKFSGDETNLRLTGIFLGFFSPVLVFRAVLRSGAGVSCSYLSVWWPDSEMYRKSEGCRVRRSADGAVLFCRPADPPDSSTNSSSAVWPGAHLYL